ncbi:MAG: hypothetical protein QM796_00560 [Chthoniobacteraceae bacterium]
MRFPATAGWLAVVLMATSAFAQSNSSLSDQNIEFTEAKLTLESAAADNEKLREQLKTAQDQVKSLTQSLALSTSESEVFRREATDLRLKMEALGLDSADPDRSKLEQRLLKAVRDLQIEHENRDHLSEVIVKLCDAVLRFLKTAESNDAQARSDVEGQMRAASEALGISGSNVADASAVPASITDGMVISIKQELALVVANVGSKQGVKLGMPFQVWRGDKVIALVRVVDVRDTISGAVIQNLVSSKEAIKVGDLLRVDAQQ